MTGTAITPDIRRKWYGLALRHLRMASRLLRHGFADGATFHAYHAFECLLSAHIAANGYDVPPEGAQVQQVRPGKSIKVFPSPRGVIPEPSAHKARIIFFGEVADTTKPYFTTFATLKRFLTVNLRMDALYYDPKADLLPHDQFTQSFADGAIRQVRQFAKELWQEIG
ncbi:hypothetical protein BH11ARM1_BH11ARM1_10410 [soil metagenome]